MDLVLKGDNLGERQREINAYVKETVSRNIDINELKDQNELSDVFKLAKIDIASKYKRVDYMLEILKSGDPLLISRVLKCICLYTEEFSNIMNAEYLHHNVFPFMSIKMKKKMLSRIPVYLRDENRAAEFYNYCLNNKSDNLAYKYLLFTSESFKLDLIKRDATFRNTVSYRANDYLKHFIKNSFILAEELLRTEGKYTMLYKLRFLYSVSNGTFLDLLEKQYNDKKSMFDLNHFQFGLRHSKDVMTRYKDRVFNNTPLYVKILDKRTLLKYSSAADAKIYTTALMPQNIRDFWMTYYDSYSDIIELIPHAERFEHIKNVFTNKYLKEAHTASDQFDNKYNILMTSEQREAWALRLLESKINLTDEDFKLYTFGNFDRGFEEMKRRIIITPDNNKRLHYLNILVESAKNQRQIEKLLSYFYERHVNEQTSIKTQFIDKVIRHHNVIEFDESCWIPLNKIFHSLGVYHTKSRYQAKSRRRRRDNNVNYSDYKKLALVYYITKGMDVPRPLKYYIENDSCVIIHILSNNLTDEQTEKVYLYLLDFYVEKVNTFENETYDDDVKKAVRKYIKFIVNILHDKKIKWQYPDIVSKFVTLDWDTFKSHPYYITEPEQNLKPKRLTQTHLLQKLKKQGRSICDNDLPLLMKELDRNRRTLKLDVFLKKMKVYFQMDNMDVGNKFLRCLIEFLSKGEEDEIVIQKIVQAIVFSIFQLADENFKVQFMLEHTPIDAKIKHDTIDEKLLYIRQAICAYACFSRPPIPLDVMAKYIKGDYVKYCLPMFYSYPVHLPPPLNTKFIESLLDKELSVQKHGVRLAFQYFTTEHSLLIATSAWNKTKNVSLRRILYEAVFNKILSVDTDKDIQDKFYDLVKKFTSDLHEDDAEEIFNLLISDKLPKKYLDDFIATAWETVIQLPKNNINNLKRIKGVVECMTRNLSPKQNYITPGTTRSPFRQAAVSPCLGFNEYDRFAHPPGANSFR